MRIRNFLVSMINDYFLGIGKGGEIRVYGVCKPITVAKLMILFDFTETVLFVLYFSFIKIDVW